MQQAVDTIMRRFTEADKNDHDLSDDLSYYFEPFEFKYLRSSVDDAERSKYVSEGGTNGKTEVHTSSTTQNRHFTFVGSPPDFIAREVAMLQAKASAMAASAASSSSATNQNNSQPSASSSAGSSGVFSGSTTHARSTINLGSTASHLTSSARATALSSSGGGGASSSIFRSTREHTMQQSGSRQQAGASSGPIKTLSLDAVKKRRQEAAMLVVEATPSATVSKIATTTTVTKDGVSDETQPSEKEAVTDKPTEEATDGAAPRKRRKKTPVATAGTDNVSSTTLAATETLTAVMSEEYIPVSVESVAPPLIDSATQSSSHSTDKQVQPAVTIKLEADNPPQQEASDLSTPLDAKTLFQSSALLTEPDRQVITKFVSQDPVAAAKWPNMKIKLNESVQVCYSLFSENYFLLILFTCLLAYCSLFSQPAMASDIRRQKFWSSTSDNIHGAYRKSEKICPSVEVLL